METCDTGRGTALESEFEHMADLVLVILCVAGGMLMWQTHGWLMAVSSVPVSYTHLTLPTTPYV